jgi:hypothetical protein
MLTTLLSILMSLFPARYRGRLFHAANLDVQRGCLLSGIIQIVLPALYLWLRYPAWYGNYVQAIVNQVIAKGGTQEAQAAAALGAGSFAIFTYLISPLTLLFVYTMFEGVVRLTAFVTSKEVLPSLPLQLIAWLHGRISKSARESARGPRVVDVVKTGPSPEMIVVESCRPKSWDTLLTISYMDQMYELESTAQQPPPRRFVYRLRIIPANKLIRGIHQYEPDETLTPTP